MYYKYMARKGLGRGRLRLVLVISIIVLCVYIGFELGKKWEGYKLLRIVDGDTILVHNLRTGEDQRLRLMGINAPDSRSCYFDAAGAMLNKILLGKKLKYEVFGHDGFGRILGIVYANNTDVAEKMVSSGAALAYSAKDVHDVMKPSDAYFDALQLLQEKPRYERLGVWSDLCLK